MRHKDRDAYTQQDMRLLTRVAAQITPAIKNAQLLEQTRSLAQVEERARVSREMHDSVGQGLSGLLWQVDQLEIAADKRPEVMPLVLERIRRAASASLLETRRAIWNLRSRGDEYRGVGDALRVEALRIAATGHLACDVQIHGSAVEHDAMIELAILRAGQELVTNVVRHANASMVNVHLHYEPQGVKVVVEDDGRGFNVDEGSSSKSDGLGLIGLRERAAEYDGELKIESSAESGTRAEFVLRISGVKD